MVILLTGRYAGKKAVIVKNYDDGQGGRAYGHAIVVGLQKEPRKVCIAYGRHRYASLDAWRVGMSMQPLHAATISSSGQQPPVTLLVYTAHRHC